MMLTIHRGVRIELARRKPVILGSSLETDRSPTSGLTERGAGEGSHTVAPPWTKYPVALGSESLGDSSRATEKRETPGGQNKSEIQKKENKQRIERGRAPCVCEVGRSDPAAVGGEWRCKIQNA